MNVSTDNPRDIVDHFLKSVKNVEQEEGKEATQGLTVLHYQMLIADVFLGIIDYCKHRHFRNVLIFAHFAKVLNYVSSSASAWIPANGYWRPSGR